MNKLFRLYLRGFKKDSSSTAYKNNQYSDSNSKTFNNLNTKPLTVKDLSNKTFKAFRAFKTSTTIDYSKMITRASDVSFITKLYVFLTKVHFNQTLNNYIHSDRFREFKKKREACKKFLGIEDDDELDRYLRSYKSQTADDEN